MAVSTDNSLIEKQNGATICQEPYWHLIANVNGSENISPATLDSISGTNTVSTNTPPSSLSSSNTTAQSSPKTDRDRIFDNMHNFIGAGVLRKWRVDYEGVRRAVEDFPESELLNLHRHCWVREQVVESETGKWSGVRVFVLPDDAGRKEIPRSSKFLRRAFRVVLEKVDRSVAAWEGKDSVTENKKASDAEEDESLWYIFNTLQNPNPQPEAMKDRYAKRAMEELLSVTAEGDAETEQGFCGVIGLKTPLYPYQRRSAAMMVQREAQPALVLDPRLQELESPEGVQYYWDKEEGTILREPKLYSEACGGILAETMGCGKTLICLAVILATKNHFPQIPLQYQVMENSVREKTGSLFDMAAAAAGRFSLPWKSHFDDLKRYGESYDKCVKACKANQGTYIIPPPPTKYEGRAAGAFPRPPAQHICLCSGTLIIVPPNLVNHWEHEIATHTEGLNVFVLCDNRVPTPATDDLLQYDIILFSRTRFEKETGQVVNNRLFFTKKEDSPLMNLHWLRVIVDEGHNVAGGQTNMVHLLSQLHVERRWMVSGTPSTGLYGVEISLASQETSDADRSEATSAALKGRKKTGNAIANENKDLENLRRIVTKFLDFKPWSNSKADDPADWTTYIRPIGKDGKRHKAPSLRATLQSLVMRHGLDTIHQEKPLPPLHNKVVYLEPTFYDKLALNLFIFILEVNAITSERQDQDYMFHPKNRRHLSLTISNLRQAGFWWTGFTEEDISATMDNARKYLDTHYDNMSEYDCVTLIQGIQIAEKALSDGGWNAFRCMHELGVFVQNFPDHARGLWALSPESLSEPLLLGVTQARQAQNFVTKHLNNYDPTEGLAGAGIKARKELTEREDHGHDAGKKTTPETIVKPKKSPSKTFALGRFRTLSPESPLAETKLVGTASAKLTYLLDQVLEHHKEEKIIIFYDNNNSAFWIAEGLEVLGIDFRIYANALRPALRTEYLALFRESEEVRVLLMDLRQAAHGLHIANASRVFIVNPIWQPNVESQAIKRAHRIGQARPVFVETLVLKDTLEDKILKRRREMSDSEIKKAEKDLLDDSTMSHIIQNEGFIPLPDDEDSVRIARLRTPTGFFDCHRLPIPDDAAEIVPMPNGLPTPAKATSKKRKRAAIITDDEPDLLTPTPKRKRSADNTYVNEYGIVITPPPRASSRSPRGHGILTPGLTPPNGTPSIGSGVYLGKGSSSGSTGTSPVQKSFSIFGGE